jgi:hypothetical protein
MLKLLCIRPLRVDDHQTEIDAACVWTLEHEDVGIGNHNPPFSAISRITENLIGLLEFFSAWLLT